MRDTATFGNYQLLEKIGSGNLGEVYRVQQHNVPDVIALKRLIINKVGDNDSTAVFANEIRISQQMRHPSLIGAIDHGVVDNWPYFTLRMATQGSLRKRLESPQGLTPRMLQQFAGDLGNALHAMHNLGFTHCDLNPQNIVFDQGRAHLIDFGTATKLGCKQTHPTGSYAYMSPEQVRGEVLDARSDVFVCAAVLWECIMGVPLFLRNAQHLCFMAVVEAEASPMPERFSSVEFALRPALSKQPSMRPRSIMELISSFVDAL